MLLRYPIHSVLSLFLLPLFLLLYKDVQVEPVIQQKKILPPQCTGVLGSNLMPQGDFGAGSDSILTIDPGFSPTYGYSFFGPPDLGNYTITNNTAGWAGSADIWLNIGDNSNDPEGYMMVIDADLNPGIFYEQVVEVCPNTTYDFSADIINMIEPAAPPLLQPNVDFLVDGVSELSTGDIPQDGNWQNFGLTFTTSPNQTSVTISLRNNASGDAGNDLAIDNITLRPCAANISISESNPINHCPGDTVTLSVTLEPRVGNEFFQWQVSTDGGQTWVNFAVPTADTFLIAEDIPNNAQFQIITASSLDNLLNFACIATGGLAILAYNPSEDCLTSVTALGSLCTGSLGQNVIPNGDFGSGAENILPNDPGFAPGYIYELNPPPNDGAYTITNTTEPWGGFAADTWINIGDNSDDTEGYMMVVNASEVPGLFFLDTIEVCENTVYQFSTDVISMNKPEISAGLIEPNISFLIDGIDVFNTGNVPIDSTWRTFGFSFTTASGVSQIILGLRNNTPGGLGFVGNDLAIDNIFLKACGSDISLSELNPVTHCAGDTITVNANLGSGFDSPVFQWQTSTDGGMTFVNAGAPTIDSVFTSNSISTNAQVRVLVANSSTNLGSPACNIISDTISLVFDDINNCLNLPINVMEESCSGQLGNNIVPNGNFGSDTLQFGAPLADGITTYNYVIDSFNMDGAYTITNFLEYDPCFGLAPDSCWLNIGDNSDDSLGYFMVVNADFEPGIFFQSEITGLCENTTYQFSADIINLNSAMFFPFNPDGTDTTILPNIDFLVAPTGTPLQVLEIMPPTDNTGDILNDTMWHTFGFTFTMKPGETDFLLALRNNSPGGGGNDIGLDNITVSVCGPVSTIEPYSICPDETLRLEANIQGDQFANPAIQWLESTNGGQSFNLLNGETNPSLDLGVPTPGNIYAYFVANDAVAITQENCRINSELDTISVIPVLIDTLDAVICDDLSIQVGNSIYTESGSYVDTLTSSLGCDSIVLLNLEVINRVTTNLDLTICEGQSVMIGDSVFTQSGNFSQTLRSTNGCDSIVNLNLQVTNQIINNLVADLCEGDSIIVGNSTYFTAGIFRDTLPSAAGCDSIIISDIQVSELGNFAITGPTFICQGNAITLDAGNQSTYSWSTGSTASSIEVNTAGVYSVIVSDAFGCTAEDEIEVSISQLGATPNVIPPSCFGEADASIIIENIMGGSGDYLFTIDNLPPQPDSIFTGLTAGAYSITLEDSVLGCSFTTSITITPPAPLKVDLGEDQVIGLSDSIPLSLDLDFSADSIVWTPTDSLSCTNCPNPIANPASTTTYLVEVFDANGCSETDEITIQVQVLRRVFIPNAFSPNGDGRNEVFTIFGGNEVAEINELKIFDRWGNLVFESGPFIPGDLGAGWDGTYKGQEVNTGVYVYFANITYTDGETEVLKGDVMVLR